MATTYRDKDGNDVLEQELLRRKNENETLALKFFHDIPKKDGCFDKEFLQYE